VAGTLPTASTFIETIVISCFLFVAAGVLEELVHATAARPWAVSQEFQFDGLLNPQLACVTNREGLSKRARRGVTLYCVGWLCMIGGDELGVLLLGSPAQLGLIPKPPFVAPAVTAQTVASGMFWVGVMVALGSVVILIREAKPQKMKPKNSE